MRDDNDNEPMYHIAQNPMCHVPQDHMQGLQNISCTRMVDDETLVTPPEQFTDTHIDVSTTNNLIDRFLQSCQSKSEIQSRVEDQNNKCQTKDQGVCTLNSTDFKTLSSVESEAQNIDFCNKFEKTLLTDGDIEKEVQDLFQNSKEASKHIGLLKDESDNLFGELQYHFPRLKNLNASIKDEKNNLTREAIMYDLLNKCENTQHDNEDINEKSDDSEGEILDTLNENLITKKLGHLEDEEKFIRKELQDIDEDMRKIEERLKETATDYEVNKFRLHGSDIEKIVSLVLSLTGRIEKILGSLDNMDWNGVEERDDLERKRDKLLEQLKEAKLIWNNTGKRTRIVIGYIENFVSRVEGIKFRRLINRRIRTMFEIKEIQEKIEIKRKQLEHCASEIVLL